MVLTPNAVLDLYLLLVDLAATPVLHRYSRAIMVLESWYQAGVALQPSCVHESSGLVHTRSSATTVVCCPPNRHRVAGISIDGSHPPLHALPEKWTGSCDGAFYNCPQQSVYRNHRNTDIRRGCFALQSVSYGADALFSHGLDLEVGVGYVFDSLPVGWPLLSPSPDLYDLL
jgi:hypothetical protein